MIDQIPSIKALVRQLQHIPYLASKNIYRVVNYFLLISPEKAEQFCKTVLDSKSNIAACDRCCAWKEKSSACYYCDSHTRDKTIICVVETWQELIALEKTGGYQGLYHVLGGALSPLEGIGPEDLSLKTLTARLSGVSEVILATNQTPEGEATATFVANALKKFPALKISCLSRGIPIGSPLEFVDRVTVYKALMERRPF